MSLFFDVMLALASGITKDDFVCGRRSGDHGTTPQPLNEEDQANRKEARRILWDALNGFEMKGGIANREIFN